MSRRQGPGKLRNRLAYDLSGPRWAALLASVAAIGSGATPSLAEGDPSALPRLTTPAAPIFGEHSAPEGRLYRRSESRTVATDWTSAPPLYSGGGVAANRRTAAIRQLPPPPGSINVALSGLLALGAWNKLRTARSAPWATLLDRQDWYHCTACVQVGDAVVLDLPTSMPTACWLQATPADTCGSSRQPAECINNAGPRSQFFTPTAIPRGPPQKS